jgi:outer membrane protein, heavy metal efflux system
MNTLGILASVVLFTTGAHQVADPRDRGSADTGSPDRGAQVDPVPDSLALDSLVQIALRQNPRVTAGRERVRASESRVSSSGTLPDPVLSLGLQNFPISDPGFDDFMTMKMIGVSMNLPYWGKLSLGEEAARGEVTAAEAALDDVRLDIERQVRQAWYDLAFIDRSTEVVERHLDVLSALVGAADVQYAVGTAGQEDVLRAQVEVTSLADELVRLAARRRAVSATLNQLLNRGPAERVGPARVPDPILAAAVPARADVGFFSGDPAAAMSDSPLRPLDELLEVVVAGSPTVHEYLARIDAQTARRDLAGKMHMPDFGLALSYGQRNDRTDMMSLNVAIPLSLNRGARQDAWVADAEADLSLLRAEYADHVTRLQSRVTELYSDLERDRSSLMLLTTGMVPQGAAALQAATAGFSVGRTDFQTVVANQAALFRFETAFHRTVTDFANNLAELERLVGEEILR